MRAKILVVEDDILFNETIRDYLEDCGYECKGVLDFKSALDECYFQNYDLYLLDINLPFENGLTLLKSLRDSGDETPALFMTSRDDRVSLLKGLEIGADDYMRKPIDLEELRLRIEAIFRRSKISKNYQIDGYFIDTSRYKLYKDGKEIELGKKVFTLLLMLLRAEGDTVTMDEIYKSLWNTAEEASYGALRVYINRLKKLFGNRIENIRGIGYRFDINGDKEC